MLFLALKEGCRLDTPQLSSMARIERALPVSLVVSWRIGLLMGFGRAFPDWHAQRLVQESQNGGKRGASRQAR